MNPDNFPLVSPDLVKALDEAFPLQEINQNDTFEAIRWRAAQRSVIQHLKGVSEAQSEGRTLKET